MTTYKKPDVEVFQQFTRPAANVAGAVLQTAIVGPMYQLFNEEVLGSYDNAENLYYLPSGLLDTSEIDQGSFSVDVIHYGETFHVSESSRRVTSANGVSTDGSATFTDDSVDFVAAGVVAHTGADTDDGDYLHIPVGANAGYHKILAVVDSHTLTLGENLSADNSEEEYDVVTVGYVLNDEDPTNRSITLTPNLGFFGDVTISMRALRKDRLNAPYYWDSLEGIETSAGGKDQLSVSNPLPHVSSKVVGVLGTAQFVLAVQTDGTDTAAYQKAFEVLETVECYNIVPLTQNKDVHLLLKDHVLALSAPEEKKERVGLVSAPWMDEHVKTGFFSVSDGMTAPNGLTLDGTIVLGGESTLDGNDVVVYEEVNVVLDQAEHVVTPQSAGTNRAVVNFGMTGENVANGTVIEYDLTSAVGTFVPVAADTDEYHVAIQAPVGDTINSIKVTSAQNTPSAYMIVSMYDTVDAPTYTEFASMTASGQVTLLDPRSDSLSIGAGEVSAGKVPLSGVPADFGQVKVRIAGLQNFVNGVDYVISMTAGTAYVEWLGRPMADSVVQGQTLLASYQAATITIDEVIPTPGHKGLKIRRYNVGQANPDPLAPVSLPEGMSLYVITANHNYMLTQAGSYNFPEEIVQIYKVTSTTAAASLANVLVNVDLQIMTEAGTYERNRFIDLDGEFITKDEIEAGDILEIKSGENAGRYTVVTVKSNTELVVDTLWTSFEENLEYQIVKAELTKEESANMYKAYGEGFGTRRMIHVMAPVVGLMDDGVNMETVPGYYAAAMIGAYSQAMAPQNGMTNMSVTGFSRVFFTSDYFLDRHLDTIASGGNFIIAQPNVWTQPFVRHQLTTNMESLEKKEFSCVRALDYMAKMGRETFRPYIGRYLINEETMTTLYSVGNSITARWEADGLANQATLESISVDPTQRDRVIVCMFIEIPVPLNYIKLVLFV